MKNFGPKPVLILMFIALITASCAKDAKLSGRDEMSFEQRLEGAWELIAVKYSSEFPNPQNPLQTIQVDGDGEDVEGLFVLGHDPNKLDYSYDFIANLQLVDSIPAIPVPVSRSGAGTWSATSDGSRIFVTETDQSSYTFIVKENSLNRQVYETTVEETLLGVFTIEVDVELTFIRS